MSRVVVLDAGPLGLVTNPRRSATSAACATWLQALLSDGSRVVLPEIADCEVRREHEPISSVANWAKGLDDNGRPILNPEKVATIPGAIVNGSTTNWPPPAHSPDTGLFYVPENNAHSIVYLIDLDPRVLRALDTGLVDSAQVVYNIFDQAPGGHALPRL